MSGQFERLDDAIAKVTDPRARARLRASAAAARVIDSRQEVDALRAADAPRQLRANARAALNDVRQLRADVERQQRRESRPGRLDHAEIDAQNRTTR